MVTKTRRLLVVAQPDVPPVVYSGAIRAAASALSIGPAFALTLAKDGKLPGVHRHGADYELSRQELNAAIYDLGVALASVSKWRGVIDPKFGLDQRDGLPPADGGANLGEVWTWPDYMRSRHYCGACNHDGRTNQLAYKQPCYGREPSRYMRS